MIIITCDICNKEIARPEYYSETRKFTKIYTDPLNKRSVGFYCCNDCETRAFKEFDERLKESADRLTKAVEEYDHRLDVVLPKRDKDDHYDW